MRKLAIAVHDDRVSRVDLTVCPDVALYLLNKKRDLLARMENETRKKVVIRHDSQLGLDEMRLQLFDMREGLVYLEVLGMTPEEQFDPRQQRAGGRDRGRGRRDGRRPHPSQRHQQHDEPRRESERFDMDHAEEAVDSRDEHFAEETAASVASPAPVLASSPSETSERDEPEPESENVIEVDEASEPIGEAPGSFDEGREGGGRHGRSRRRGRRGGRGRNRGQDRPAQHAPQHASQPQQRDESPEPHEDSESSENQPPMDDGPEPGNELPASPEQGEQQPHRRRRRRGGRRHRRNRDNVAANGNVPPPHPNSSPASGPPAPPTQRVPPPRPSEPPPPIVRTGSTDKHLIHDDVPVHPEPPRRPRTYRDLDAIPDDMD
jgi:ribonuclease E